MNVEFRTEVRKRFQYLIQNYGFREIDDGGGGRSWEESVTYVSPDVKIELYHEFDLDTVGIFFKDLGANDTQTWEFHTFLKLVDRELARTFGRSIPKNETELLELLDMYAGALR